MKFVAATLVVLLMSGVLGAGMLLASHGHGIWPLVLGIIGFMTLFVRYGCRAH